MTVRGPDSPDTHAGIASNMTFAQVAGNRGISFRTVLDYLKIESPLFGGHAGQNTRQVAPKHHHTCTLIGYDNPWPLSTLLSDLFLKEVWGEEPYQMCDLNVPS